MSKCLVTGHKGYIGAHLYKELVECGHEVIGIDLQEEISKDINSLQGLKKDENGNFHPHFWNFKPEFIFHLACFPRVAYSVENPVLTMENNVLATSRVLDFANRVGAKRVIYSSSSSVVGNGDGPTSPYGLQKLFSEMECKLYSELYGVDTVCLRYFNVYSEDQQADGPYATAIANWMKFIRENRSPFITGTGEQKRDMLHVSDAVQANMFAMRYHKNFSGKNYDVGTGENISLNKVRDIVYNHFPDVNFDYVEERKGDVFETKANTEPLEDLGWKAQMNIDKGIEKCFRSLKDELS